MLVKFTTGRIY